MYILFFCCINETENITTLKYQKNIISYLIAVVAAIATFLILGLITYFIACYFSPPVIVDHVTGQVNGLMPIGQSIIALVSATMGSIWVFILVLKRLRKQVAKEPKDSSS